MHSKWWFFFNRWEGIHCKITRSLVAEQGYWRQDRFPVHSLNLQDLVLKWHETKPIFLKRISFTTIGDLKKKRQEKGWCAVAALRQDFWSLLFMPLNRGAGSTIGKRLAEDAYPRCEFWVTRLCQQCPSQDGGTGRGNDHWDLCLCFLSPSLRKELLKTPRGSLGPTGHETVRAGIQQALRAE